MLLSKLIYFIILALVSKTTKGDILYHTVLPKTGIQSLRDGVNIERRPLSLDGCVRAFITSNISLSPLIDDNDAGFSYYSSFIFSDLFTSHSWTRQYTWTNTPNNLGFGNNWRHPSCSTVDGCLGQLNLIEPSGSSLGLVKCSNQENLWIIRENVTHKVVVLRTNLDNEPCRPPTNVNCFWPNFTTNISLFFSNELVPNNNIQLTYIPLKRVTSTVIIQTAGFKPSNSMIDSPTIKKITLVLWPDKTDIDQLLWFIKGFTSKKVSHMSLNDNDDWVQIDHESAITSFNMNSNSDVITDLISETTLTQNTTELTFIRLPYGEQSIPQNSMRISEKNIDNESNLQDISCDWWCNIKNFFIKLMN